MSEINPNEEVTMVVEDAEIITTPIDETLTVSGAAADAKAVGDALALKADVSQINTIKVNDESADNQGQILIDGTGIPMSEDDETTLTDAIQAEQGKTGEDIPLDNSEDAPTVAEAIAAADRDATEIQMSSEDTTTVSAHILALEDQATGCVKKVNGTTPDENGNVQINKVDIADNLDSSIRQNSSGEYIVRTAGGAASLSDGPATLLRVSGNSVRTGYVQENIDFNVSGESIDASITDLDTFREEMGDSGTLTLNYTTGWSADPATYGITVVGTPENGDSIVVVWVKEVRGSITNAEPTGFSVTGWNLFNLTSGVARVVKYSDDYGYGVSGAYTTIQFSATENGERTTITPANGLFNVPSDGYVWVTGGNNTTAIWATWSDWVNGYPGEYAAYNKTTISLSAIMTSVFPDGLCAVDGVRDYIDIGGGYAYQWIDILEYTAENLAVAESSGRSFTYDEDNIYLAKASATVTALTGTLAVNGSYTVNGHGLEMFDGTTVAVGGMTSYGADLKNKLERDVATLSQQTLTDAQKKQVRDNISAAATSDVNAINTKLASLFKYIEYRYTIASLAADTNLNITATNFGISTPSGYKPLAPGKQFTGSANFQLSNINHTATGGATAMSVRNNANSTQTGKVAVLGIVYVRTGFGI